jgi:predicted RNase H-like nuclease (RuvC/YqgF family)
MLLNEFLKEHRRGEEQDCKIQEQETTIAELRSEIRSLAAMVNEQASELRNVGAHSCRSATRVRKRLRRIRKLRYVLAVLAAATTRSMGWQALAKECSTDSTSKCRCLRCSRNRREWNVNGRGCPIRIRDD